MAADEGVEKRLNNIETELTGVKLSSIATAQSIDRMTTAIERLVIIETEHKQTREALSRAFSEIGVNDDRISALERRTETWDYTSLGLRWLIAAVVGAALALVWFTVTGRMGG